MRFPCFHQVVGQSLQKQLATTLRFIEDAVSSGDVLIEGQQITPESPLSSLASEKEDELRVQFAVRQVRNKNTNGFLRGKGVHLQQ